MRWRIVLRPPYVEPPLPRPFSPIARVTYIRWLRAGMTPREAGNLTAWGSGVRPVTTGWTVRELDRLLFYRWLWETRRESRG